MEATNKTCPVCKGAVSSSDASCPSCGFKLQGSTQKFAPVEVDDGKPSTATSAPQKLEQPTSLTILRGPQVGIRIGLVADAGPLTVGRSPKCEVFLNDMTVSRRHAVIEHTDEGYRISDQDSFNGIWINNKNVTSAILKNGDIIQIGAFCLRVDC